MKKNDATDARENDTTTALSRKPYTPPRIEKRQPIARVTLLSGMGMTSVAVISVMN